MWFLCVIWLCALNTTWKWQFKKNALSKIKSQCHVDFKHIFESKIVQVLSEKNVFKLDAILKSSSYFSVYFDFVRYLWHENDNLKKNALSKIESLCYANSKYFPRKTLFNLTNFKFASVWSGGGGRLCLTIFESPANGGGGRGVGYVRAILPCAGASECLIIKNWGNVIIQHRGNRTWFLNKA
jgi:hypothetical protein